MNSVPIDGRPDVALTHDTILGGKLHLVQPAVGHRAGTDAVLLAAAVSHASGTIIDVGAGVGTVGLALALRNIALRAILLERDATFASLARQNAAANGLSDRVSVAETDVLLPLPRRSAGIRNEAADVVVTNPPFYPRGRGREAADALKREAHVLDRDGDVEGWLRACCTLLRPGGTLAFIHLPEFLTPSLAALRGRTGGARIRPVHARADGCATRILVTAVKGSRAPLQLLPPLVLHEANGAFTAEALALHDGSATLHQ